MGRQIGAVFAGTLTMAVAGFLFYGLALASFFAGNVQMEGAFKQMPVWWALTVGNAAYAMLLVYLMGRIPNTTGFAGGAKLGASVGFLVGLSWDFTLLGTANTLNLTGSLVDVVVYTVMSALVGGAAGAVLGGGQRTA